MNLSNLGLTRRDRDGNVHCSGMMEWDEKQRRVAGLEKSILDPQLKVSRYRFSNFLVLMSQRIRGDSPAEIAEWL